MRYVTYNMHDNIKCHINIIDAKVLFSVISSVNNTDINSFINMLIIIVTFYY